MADGTDQLLEQLRLRIQKPGHDRYTRAVDATIQALKAVLRDASGAPPGANLQRHLQQALPILAGMDVPALCETILRNCRGAFDQELKTAGKSGDITKYAPVAIEQAWRTALKGAYKFDDKHKTAAPLIDSVAKEALGRVPGLGAVVAGLETLIRARHRETISEKWHSAEGGMAHLAVDTGFAMAGQHVLLPALALAAVPGGQAAAALIVAGVVVSYATDAWVIRKYIDPGPGAGKTTKPAPHDPVQDRRLQADCHRRLARKLFSESHP